MPSAQPNEPNNYAGVGSNPAGSPVEQASKIADVVNASNAEEGPKNPLP